MDETEVGQDVYESDLSSPGDARTRFALASLVGSDLFWAAFVVVLPVLLVAASVLHPGVASFAAGSLAVLWLWLLWMSHEFVATRFQVDVEGTTLRKSKPYSDEYYGAVSPDEIESACVLRFSRVALVRFRYGNMLVSKPLAVAVETAAVQDVISDLRAMGVDVSVRRRSLFTLSTEPINVRVLGTPIVVFGALVALGGLHGSSAFATDGFVVPMLVLLVFALYGGFYRNRLDRDEA